MERREFLNLSSTAIGALVSGSLLNSCQNTPKNKPNIVFILFDDLGWKDAGYMESKYYETPNIDRLSKQGMILTDAYANAAN